MAGLPLNRESLNHRQDVMLSTTMPGKLYPAAPNRSPGSYMYSDRTQGQFPVTYVA